MPDRLPIVCIFGTDSLVLSSGPKARDSATRKLDCRCYPDDRDLERILAEDQPDVIVTIGRPEDYPKLMAAPADVSRRWINFEDAADPARMGASAFHCFLDNCVRERTDLPPLVSVFTPTYRTGQRIERPYRSLQNQRYKNWEWIIVDDSDDDGETFSRLSALAQADHRVQVFKAHAHSGVIGRVKKWACQLCNGPILVELDHDDELTPNALADVVSAFDYFDGSTPKRPLAGFAYTDFAELFPDGRPVTYAEGWAYGYGRYRWERHGDRDLAVALAPNINAKTIRHIVGVPNHARAWRADLYREIGGHGRFVHVADDYELLVRTFLETRMTRIPRLGYLQWRNSGGEITGGNTHQERNAEIQRLTLAFSKHYDKAIHRRFEELGVDDFVYDENEPSIYRLNRVPNPPAEPHCTLIAP
jgi:glycosyltransferase involved in cell wall biosynthesis